MSGLESKRIIQAVQRPYADWLSQAFVLEEHSEVNVIFGFSVLAHPHEIYC